MIFYLFTQKWESITINGASKGVAPRNQGVSGFRWMISHDSARYDYVRYVLLYITYFTLRSRLHVHYIYIQMYLYLYVLVLYIHILHVHVLVCILTVYTQIVKCVSKVHMIQIWRCISISMCIYLYLFSKPTSQALDAEAPLRTWHVCMGDLRPTHGNVTVWKMLMIDQIWRKWWDIVDIVV